MRGLATHKKKRKHNKDCCHDKNPRRIGLQLQKALENLNPP